MQFRVYRLGKDKVIKKPTTRAQKISLFKSWGPKSKARLRKDVFGAERITDRSIYGIQKIIKRIDPEIIASPTFLKHPSYEQNLAMPLGKYFVRHSLRENKVIVDKYVKCMIQTWRYGFSDTVFNFTINNGIRNGKVVLIDIGELSFLKKKVKKLVKVKKWLTHWSYMNLTDPKLKEYFEKIMDYKVTLKALKKNWKIDL